MNESHRVAYLKAMGIDQYYPRRELPRARPSPSFQFEQAVPVEPQAKPQPKSQPKSQLQAPLIKKKATVEPAALTAVPKKAKTPVTERAAAFSFHLEFYRVHPELAIIADRPPQGSADQLQQARELLLAILRAVLPAAPDKLPAALGFSWPLATDMATNSSPEQAALALQGFVRSKQEQHGFGSLLVFTETLNGLVHDGDGDGQDVTVEFTGRNLQLTVCHSLHSMLSVPALKRDTWQALQGLKERLQLSA